MSNENAIDAKQKAFTALALAADMFFRVTLIERAKTAPGAAQAAQVLVEEGRAHIAISIQSNGRELKAALALVAPEFVAVLDSPEMTLQGPLAAAFADPDKLTINDLSKLN